MRKIGVRSSDRTLTGWASHDFFKAGLYFATHEEPRETGFSKRRGTVVATSPRVSSSSVTVGYLRSSLRRPHGIAFFDNTEVIATSPLHPEAELRALMQRDDLERAYYDRRGASLYPTCSKWLGTSAFA